MASLEDAPFTGPLGPLAWSRPELDLDTLTGDVATRLLERDRPEIVVHAAAWTDVDACAVDPGLARRRNAVATGALASACAAAGVDLVLLSTNEVFDGERTDGLGYRSDDPPAPGNPYGASKLEAELLATAAVTGGTGPVPGDRADDGVPGRLPRPAPGARLAIVRTAWLHGPPGNDFPARILAAADRALATGEALRVVADEVGSPTYAPDLAEAIVELIGADALTPPGRAAAVHHLVNPGRVSRAGWARAVLHALDVRVRVDEIPSASWDRASRPPRWAVLEPTPLPSGESMRPWREAFADAVPALRRARGEGSR